MGYDQEKKFEDDAAVDLEQKIAEAMKAIVTDTVGEVSVSEMKVTENTPGIKGGSHIENTEKAAPGESAPQDKKSARKSARPHGSSMRPLQLDYFDTLSEELAASDEKAEPEEDRVQPEKKVQEKQHREEGAGHPVYSVPVETEEFMKNKPKKKHKGLKITGVVLAMLVVLAGGFYAGVSYYYSDKFFEGTVINGINCSGKTAAEVEKEIEARVENYSLTVRARNQEPQVINGTDINYKYMSNGDILNFLQSQKPYEWIRGYLGTSSYAAEENVTFDRTLLQTKLEELNCSKTENQVAPENAYIAYGASQFEIVPETQGSTILPQKALQAMEDAVASSRQEVDFNQENVYETASVRQDDPKLLQALEAYNQYSRASITYVIGDQREVLDGNTIKDWLSTSGDGTLVKDNDAFRDHIRDYVAQLGQKYDTLGEARHFTATNGRQITVYSTQYGWEIDEGAEIEQLTEEINSGATVEREPIYSMTANSHDDSDVGNTYIEVDMGIQHMYYYIDGNLVFESDFISGKPDGKHDTPEGIYLLYNKESPSILRGEMKSDGTREYETNVSYWMAFNGGIGFHDATWQYWGFGGSLYQTLGSHGCINLPLDAAAQLYSIIRYGDPIVCFY